MYWWLQDRQDEEDWLLNDTIVILHQLYHLMFAARYTGQGGLVIT